MQTLPPAKCSDCDGPIVWSQDWIGIGQAYQKRGTCRCRDRQWTLTLPGEGLIDWSFKTHCPSDPPAKADSSR